jgi:hypothetical protein
LGKKTKDCSTVSYMSEIEKTGNNAFTVPKRYLLGYDRLSQLVSSKQDENE